MILCHVPWCFEPVFPFCSVTIHIVSYMYISKKPTVVSDNGSMYEAITVASVRSTIVYVRLMFIPVQVSCTLYAGCLYEDFFMLHPLLWSTFFPSVINY